KKIQENGITINFPDDFTGICPLLMPLKDGDDKLPLTPRIDSSGQAYLCQIFTDHEYSIGNIHKQNLNDILSGSQLSKLIEFFRLGQNYMHDCKKCLWNQVCGKGCVAIAVANGGSVQDADGCCSLRKKYFISALKNSNEEKEISV
ncbi:MAG: SPASM domain-containing protein, partial [Anaerocolumna sp.]